MKMEDLRRMFQALGLESVETVIASGNVIFEAEPSDLAGLEGRIEAHLKDSLGYQVATFLRTLPELAGVAAYRPFPDMDGDLLMIGFLGREPDEAARERVLALNTATDRFHLHARELYWVLKTRLSDSTITGARLEKALGMPTTLRNANTVQKIALKYS